MTRWMPATLLALCWSPAAWSQEDEAPAAPTFIRDVVPALFGGRCYSCHSGEDPGGGLRFSPLCSDPQADYQTLVRGGFGRLVNVVQPEASLLLVRPALVRPAESKCRRSFPPGAVPSTVNRATVLRWIAAGAPPPRADDPRLVALTVSPPTLTGPGGGSFRTMVTVTARWSDGVERDVTADAHFDPPEWPVDEGVHQVTTVRYLDGRAVVTSFAPKAKRLQQLDYAGDNLIDPHLAPVWQKLGIQPAEPCDDATFLRRAHLHVIGRLPSPAEVRRFLGSRASDKRLRLIDELLARPEYARHWAGVWSTWLMDGTVFPKQGHDFATDLLAALEDAMARNVPLDRLMRDCLAGDAQRPIALSAAFAGVHQTPERRADAFAATFLGARLQCAGCHNHPDENAGPLQRLALADRLEALRDTPLEQSALERALAAWPQHDFAAAVVNRYWAALFGRGLVEPADAMTSIHPASHPALLVAPAEDFAAHGYDLRRLLRTLCRSRAYQLSDGDEGDPLYGTDALFATYRPYRLSARVLFEAIHDACGVPPPAFPETSPGLGAYTYTVFPAHRALCPRNESATLAQALHLLNSDTIVKAIGHPRGRVARLVVSGKSDRRAVEELYLAALSRPPEPGYWPMIEKHLASHPRREALQDILWALINTKEFLFHH